MLLGEQLALVAIEPMHGDARAGFEFVHTPRFLATALLMELAVQTRLGLRDGRVFVQDTLPSRHPLITHSLVLMRQQKELPLPAEAIALVQRSVKNLREELLDGLVRRDILHPGKRRTLGMLGPKIYPVRSIQAQNEGVFALHEAAVGNRTDLSSLAFLFLADASGLTRLLLSEVEATEATTRVELLRGEIDQELRENPDMLDAQYSIALMVALADAVVNP